MKRANMMQTGLQQSYLRCLQTKIMKSEIIHTNIMEPKLKENKIVEPEVNMDSEVILEPQAEIQTPVIKITSLGHLTSGYTSADVTLVCGCREFPAHRLVLSGNSLYFQSLFQDSEKGSEQDVVVIPDPVTDVVLEDVLEFVYTGDISDKQDENESLRPVLSASQILKMDQLFTYSIHRLAEYLSANDLQEFFRLITEYEDTGWETEIVSHVVNKFCNMHTRSDFYTLEVNELNKMLQYVKLEKEYAEDFITALVTWLNCSQYRNDDIVSLTSICRFRYLSSALWTLFWNPNDDDNKDQRFLEVISMNNENKNVRTSSQNRICFSTEEEQEANVSYDRFM